MTVKDFKKYLNTLDDNEELSFHVCFQDRTDLETTQDWYTLEFLKDSDSSNLDFLFSPKYEKHIFQIYTKGLTMIV